jgi:phosphate transport system ATP-binding protein
MNTPEVPVSTPPIQAQSGAASAQKQDAIIDVSGMSFYYGAKRALQDISIQAQKNAVTAFIGPSGCGKSTFLRTLNRMNDVIPGTRVEGKILVGGLDIYSDSIDIVDLRRRWEWYFRNRIPSRNPSSTTLPTACD